MHHFRHAALLVAVLAYPLHAQSIDPSLETEDPGLLNSWLGHSRADILAAWGEPEKSTQRNEMEVMSYALMDATGLVASTPETRFDDGPKTQGIDTDLVRLLQKAIRQSCIVDFSINEISEVVAVDLTRFKGANDCDRSLFRLPSGQSD